MGFYDVCKTYQSLDFKEFEKKITEQHVERVLQKSYLDQEDFRVLLSSVAKKYLEPMAKKANALTTQQFGKTILLYTPMYLSNYCTNQCLYCGFNTNNTILRKQLTLDEVEKEAKAIANMGLKHLLVLTGDAKHKATPAYIGECTKVLAKYFASVSIEVYAMDEQEYVTLVECGVDGITIYQETYNEALYDEIHVKGPKKNYRYRLDAPERACSAFVRTVNIGALLGLDDWRKEFFLVGLHAQYLQSKYPETEVSISLPRLRPHKGQFKPMCIVKDADMVQMMVAMRLFMPRVGITISTRENSAFRNNVVPLGVTKMSAGSTTAVGGHTECEKSEAQFEISDNRSVKEMKQSIIALGYQPVLKDWEKIDKDNSLDSCLVGK